MLNYKMGDKDIIKYLQFTLFDANFRELFTQEYSVDIKKEIKHFCISNDEKYLAIQDKGDNLYFCYFDNGIETDLFFDNEKG